MQSRSASLLQLLRGEACAFAAASSTVYRVAQSAVFQTSIAPPPSSHRRLQVGWEAHAPARRDLNICVAGVGRGIPDGTQAGTASSYNQGCCTEIEHLAARVEKLIERKGENSASWLWTCMN